ncbi:hypothetical protein CMV_006911 [Castanea mollissima]|uniref:Uncharacterized protein n=1 Tax=Castanea mollissima TaxID=60419 RepID=A0A8J4RG60_9ROSI|nr:hypothetical protein CMV_006911 [Castanea mollissima]
MQGWVVATHRPDGRRGTCLAQQWVKLTPSALRERAQAIPSLPGSPTTRMHYKCLQGWVVVTQRPDGRRGTCFAQQWVKLTPSALRERAQAIPSLRGSPTTRRNYKGHRGTSKGTSRDTATIVVAVVVVVVVVAAAAAATTQPHREKDTHTPSGRHGTCFAQQWVKLTPSALRKRVQAIPRVHASPHCAATETIHPPPLGTGRCGLEDKWHQRWLSQRT